MTGTAHDETAVRWFVQRESGRWTTEQEAQLQSWLDNSDRHRIAWLRVQATWSHADRMRALAAGVAPGVVPARGSWGDRVFFKGVSRTAGTQAADQPRPAIMRKSAWRVPRRVAAGLGVIALATALVIGLLQGERYATAIGGLQTIALEDGSRVLLNTDSRIRVVLKAGARRVTVTRGEAFFDVTPDPQRPFIVEAGGSRVEVVGTQFAVRREGGNIQVVVTDGKVRLDATPLPAGSVARVTGGKLAVRQDTVAAAEKLLSWRTGFVNFDNRTLAEAVAEFNRYHARRIEIPDPRIGSLPLSGNFHVDNVEGFLWLLENGFPVKVEAQERRVLLRAK